MTKDRKGMYRKILGDNFPPQMKISFFGEGNPEQTLFYDKVGWDVEGEVKGLRYGENPDQEAALYRLVNGHLVFGDVRTIEPGKWLATDVELLQSGKHPGKINITDTDSALGILRYFPERPTVAIMKHNNPSGVARRDTLLGAYQEANMVDRVAAFGGAIALNRAVDNETAEAIVEGYSEVVVAPEFENGVMGVLGRKKDLRVMKIGNMAKLHEWDGAIYPEFKSLIDGGHVVQWPYVPKAREAKDLEVVTDRTPTEDEMRDLLFGWLVEAGITSNSVIYVKNDATLGIGTGEMDRVGVAKIAANKAFEKRADRVSWENNENPYNDLPDEKQEEIMQSPEVQEVLYGSCMISDAFFPFRDGVDVGIEYGATAVIQPGGSKRDKEVIEACDESGVAMVFTGQRSFKH